MPTIPYQQVKRGNKEKHPVFSQNGSFSSDINPFPFNWQSVRCSGTGEDFVSEVRFSVPQNLFHISQYVSIKADKTFWRAWGQIGTVYLESQKL